MWNKSVWMSHCFPTQNVRSKTSNSSHYLTYERWSKQSQSSLVIVSLLTARVLCFPHKKKYEKSEEYPSNDNMVEDCKSWNTRKQRFARIIYLGTGNLDLKSQSQINVTNSSSLHKSFERLIWRCVLGTTCMKSLLQRKKTQNKSGIFDVMFLTNLLSTLRYALEDCFNCWNQSIKSSKLELSGSREKFHPEVFLLVCSEITWMKYLNPELFNQ